MLFKGEKPVAPAVDEKRAEVLARCGGELERLSPAQWESLVRRESAELEALSEEQRQLRMRCQATDEWLSMLRFRAAKLWQETAQARKQQDVDAVRALVEERKSLRSRIDALQESIESEDLRCEQLAALAWEGSLRLGRALAGERAALHEYWELMKSLPGRARTLTPLSAARDFADS